MTQTNTDEGLFVIAAATKSAQAREVEDLGHRLLTYALLAGAGAVESVQGSLFGMQDPAFCIPNGGIRTTRAKFYWMVSDTLKRSNAGCCLQVEAGQDVSLSKRVLSAPSTETLNN